MGLPTYPWVQEFLSQVLRVTRDLFNVGDCAFSGLGLIHECAVSVHVQTEGFVEAQMLLVTNGAGRHHELFPWA